MSVKDEFKRFQETLTDVASIGRQELLRGVDNAKKQVVRYQFVQRRKELLAELGRTLYDGYRDGFPDSVAKYFNETEFKEIFSELEQLDADLEKRLTSVQEQP